MPNWCYNHLTIEPSPKGDGKGFKNFKTKMCLIKEDLEENKNVWTGVCDYFVGREDDYESNWYDHNCRVYGAKWQPEVEEFISSFNEEDDIVCLSFDSAWSPLSEFTKRLAVAFDLHIEHQFEETGNWFAGQLIVDGDEVIEHWSADYWEGIHKLDSDNFYETISNDFEYWVENIEMDEDTTKEEYLELVKEEFESHKSDLYFLSGSELTELENDFVEFATESYDENTIQKESGLVVHTYYVVEGRVAKFIGYNNHSGFQFNDKTGWFAHKEIPAGIELSETQNF